jgi:hypothetical protein
MLELEICANSNQNVWVPIGTVWPVAYNSSADDTASAGAQLTNSSTSTTDVLVSFFRYAVIANDDSPAYDWSSNFRWRVRKTSAGAAVGFGIVAENSAGLFPAYNTNLDNATATRLGLKQYLHGTAYNGGVAPTVGGSGVTPLRGSFVPYQTQDGTWRMRFNISVTHSGMTGGSSYSISINGATFIATYNQAFTAISGAAAPYTCSGNTATDSSNLTIYPATNATFAQMSGDVELKSKPTWAY